MDVMIGTRLGPYEIPSCIGSGGMGEVLRARDTRLNRTVAIKILAGDFAANEQRKARLIREERDSLIGALRVWRPWRET